MLIESIVARLNQRLGNGATIPPRLTPGLGSLAIAQVEGEGDEASRGGIRYRLQAGAVTGIAPVQVLPTTAAQWLIYNPASSGLNAFIDELGAWLVSGTAGAGATVLAAICGNAEVPSTRPSAIAAGVTLKNCNPRSGRVSQLVVAASQTLAANPGWSPIAWMNPANTVLGQTQMINDQIKGRIMLPPDSALALAIISPTGTTPLFAPHVSYREYGADIE